MGAELIWSIGGLTKEELVKVIPILAGTRYPRGRVTVRLDAVIASDPRRRSINVDFSARDIGENLQPEMVVGMTLEQMEQAIHRGSE